MLVRLARRTAGSESASHTPSDAMITSQPPWVTEFRCWGLLSCYRAYRCWGLSIEWWVVSGDHVAFPLPLLHGEV